MKTNAKSDLFCENFGAAEPARGARESRRTVEGFAVADGADGRGAAYCSIFVPDADPHLLNGFSAAVERCASELVSRLCGGTPRRTLVAGLGNGNEPSDSFGAALCDRLDPFEIGGAGLFVIKTGVPAQTGIPSADLVAAVAKAIRADLVIAADSLAAISPERLCRVIQFTDAGVAPGSGVSSHGDVISRATVGCPVMTAGVPCAVRGRLSRGGTEAEGLYTVCGVGTEISFFAEAAAAALNAILRPGRNSLR